MRRRPDFLFAMPLPDRGGWAVALVIALAGGTQAANIQWTTGVATGDAIVSDRGTLIEAANFGDSNTSEPTINGVPFVAIRFTAGTSPAHLVGLTYNTGEHGMLPGPGVNELFDTIAYRSGADPQTALLTGLEPGQEYEVQFFYYHGNVNRSVVIGDGEGHTVQLTETGEPLYATGTFRADGPQQRVTFDASTGSQFLNAYQLRRIETLPPVVLGQVVIPEFMASNDRTLADGDGNHPDWIEVWNSTGAAVDLDGWYLTDDRTEPAKWPFPPLVLEPDGYLIVFASGQDVVDYVDAGGYLHANFTLAKEGGESLALMRPSSTGGLEVAWSYNSFPAQETDVSYGLHGAEPPFATGYPASPTPGRRNVAEGYSGFVALTRHWPERGFHEALLEVRVASPTEGARIRYTTDGSEPTLEHGWDYPGGAGIPVSRTTVLRTAAFKDGLRPSPVQTHTYLFVSDVVEQPAQPAGFPTTWTGVDYGMEDDPADLAHIAGDVNPGPGEARAMIAESLKALPALSLVMPVEDWFGPERGIYHNPQSEGMAWERPVSAEWIWPDAAAAEGFQIDCGVRIQGFTSRDPMRNPKHSLRLVFRKDYGPGKLRYPLFGEEGPDEFDTIVLRSNSQDAWVYNSANNRLGQFVRDEWNRRAMERLGQPIPRGRWVHLYLNGLYWGVYNPTERPDASFNASHFGGEAGDYDAIKNHEEVLDGTDDAYRRLLGLIQVDPDNFGAGYRDLSARDDHEEVAAAIDIENLCDYILHNVYAAAEDWPGNYYMAYDRTEAHGGWRFFDWDNEHGLKGGVTEDRATAHWRDADSPTKFHHALRSNAEYRLTFADRLHQAFFNGGPLHVDSVHPEWDPAHPERNRPAALWMELTGALEAPLIAESARWGDYRRSPPFTVQDDFVPLRAALLRNWFPRRSAIVLEDFRIAGLYPATAAPVFSQFGGAVTEGYRLTITAPSGGTVHYTLDDGDPRMPWTSAVAPGAMTYADGLTLSTSIRVKARVLRGEEWSALTEALFIVGTPASAENLVISEIHYHPSDDDGDTEFVELMNVSEASTIDLVGVRFTAGIEYAFTGPTLLAPGERLVLVENPTDFDTRYGSGLRRLGLFSGKLDNAGEAIVLRDAQGGEIERFTYDDDFPWPEGADGNGYSLTRIAPGQRLSATHPENWRPSVALGGTPTGSDAIRFVGSPDLDKDGDGQPALLEYALGSSDQWPDTEPCLMAGRTLFENSLGQIEPGLSLTLSLNLAAEDATTTIQWSGDLARWTDAGGDVELVNRTYHGQGRVTLVYRLSDGLPRRSARFFRLAVNLR